MNNGATQVFFIGVAYGHLLSGVAGGSGGGDEPRHPWHPSSVHEADATPAQRNKQRLASSSRKSESEEGPYSSCPVCDRRFKTEKAVHGHMRSHPDRTWRGMEEPRQLDPAAAEDEKEYRYVCEHCGARFETRQALGGHRASHNGKMGCFWLSRQPNTTAAEPRPVVLPFDLNDPAPEQQQEE